jgi:surface antigen
MTWRDARTENSFLVEVCKNSRFVTISAMMLRPAVLSVICASMLSACTTANTRPSSGGGFLGRSASPSTPYIANLQGGIVARSGLQLDRGDLQKALEAEYRALEMSPGGQPVTWSNGDTSGQVVANAPYQVGNQNCRQYSHTLTVDGRETKVRGAACRNADGTWTPLT